MSIFHKPVMVREVLEFLDVRQKKKYIDATIGGAGHSWEIVTREGVLLGIDCDFAAVNYAKDKFKTAAESAKFKLIQGNFAHLKKIALENGFGKVSGILFDLGMSSWQIEKSGRGFSFLRDEPLDMRMDPNLKVTARDLINVLNKGELYELFINLGEEKRARRFADNIIRARKIKPIKRTGELVKIIEDNSYRARNRHWQEKIHPATKIFQALRIAVNDELNNLKKALPQAVDLLEQNGRLVVISFHSLEDRIVKHFFKTHAEAQREQGRNTLKILTKKPVRPSAEEIRQNPRARSAKLRAAEKI